MKLPTLSIVIPTYNGCNHLRRLLPSVCRFAPFGTQIIIVDDASTDETLIWLHAHYPGIQVVSMPTNGGFCAAANAGVERANGDVIELLNNDTEVTEGWAEAALAQFVDPTVGSVAPLVCFMDQPEVIESAGQEYHLCGWGKNRGYGKPIAKPYLEPREVFGPSASCGFYRRDILDRIGCMLPEYDAYYEDVDLSFRLRWAGYRCVYEPSSRVFHSESASYRRQRDRVVRLLARNEELVYWINLPGWDLFRSLPLHLGFIAIRAVRRTLAGQGRLYLAAKWEALTQWKWVLERRRKLRQLARRAPGRLELRVASDPVILKTGWEWMASRKSA